MKFSEYLKSTGKSIPDAAKELVVTVEAVRFWDKGIKTPSSDNMTSIFKWSNGMVQPNDFYVLPEIEDARANGHTLVQMTTGAAA